MYKYPYGNMQQLNLDWFLAEWEKFKQEADEALGGIDGALQAEIDRVEAAMTDLYAARDAAIAARDAAREARTDAANYAISSANSAASSANSAQSSLSASASAAQRAAAALTSEQNANNSAGDAEAWAVGTRFTVPVPSTTAQYQNNSKWWAEKAKEWYDAAEALISSLPEDVTELVNMYETLAPLAEDETLTGAIVKFESSFAGAPVKQITVEIEPVQSGTAITGYTTAVLSHAGENLFEGDGILRASGWTKNNDVYSGNIYQLSNLSRWNWHKYGFNAVQKHVLGLNYYLSLHFSRPTGSNGTMFLNARVKRADGTTARTPAVGSISTEGDYTLAVEVSADEYVDDVWFSYGSAGTVDLSKIMLSNSANSTFEPYQEKHNVQLPAAAGTVYDGKITINGDGSGDALITGISATLTESNYADTTADGRAMLTYPAGLLQEESGLVACSNLLIADTETTDNSIEFGAENIFIRIDSAAQDYSTWLANNNINIVAKLATPISYTLTPSEVGNIITTLKGVNNVFADSGNVTVTAGSYVEEISDQMATKASKDIVCANEETGTRASKNYAVNDFLIRNNQLYKVTATIAQGATLTAGTNITATTITAEITALLNS